MSALAGEELENALKDDVAIKSSAQSFVEVDPTLIAKGIEAKQTVLAKTVSLGLIDLARYCTTLAAAEVTPHVMKKGDEFVQVPPKVDTARMQKLLEAAEKALLLARQADVLGDRSIARNPEPVSKD